jgi:hypothetical protein
MLKLVDIRVLLFLTIAAIITPKHAAASVIQTALYHGHTYYLLDKGPWWDACEAEAVTLGGHLATINDQAENDFIFNTFGPTVEEEEGLVSLFIGLNDLQEEGTFAWVSGEPVSFTNWASGQPQSGFEDEDYVGIHVNFGEPGKWHDIVSDARLNDVPFGVVETDVPEPASLSLLALGGCALLRRRR